MSRITIMTHVDGEFWLVEYFGFFWGHEHLQYLPCFGIWWRPKYNKMHLIMGFSALLLVLMNAASSDTGRRMDTDCGAKLEVSWKDGVVYSGMKDITNCTKNSHTFLAVSWILPCITDYMTCTSMGLDDPLSDLLLLRTPQFFQWLCRSWSASPVSYTHLTLPTKA